MSQQDRTALLEYYALDKEVADVYEHKCELDVREPHLSSEAARARRRLLASLGIASDQ
jgi:hypothetical protein